MLKYIEKNCASSWSFTKNQRRYLGERCVGGCSCTTETGTTLDKEHTQVYLLGYGCIKCMWRVIN